MTASIASPSRAARSRGFSLIEIMIGVVIGLIAILVIYQVFAASEGLKRNTTGAGDAQQNGLLASFLLSIELANASNGVADAINDLMNCSPTPDPATSLRPFSILITDSGVDTDPDSFVVNYSVAQRVVAPVPFIAPNGGAGFYHVQSPNAFKPGDLVIAIPAAPGNCSISKVTAVSAVDPASGAVTLTHTGAVVFNDGDQLLDFGPSKSGQRVSYDVSSGVLRGTPLWTDTGAADGAPTPNPIASNVVVMKLLYGIDNGAGGVTWTAATGAWSPASLLAANASTLSKIRAVRIGIVVRSEQWDKDLLTPQSWTLFADAPAAVQRTGTIAPAGGNYRLRQYETIIPVRNSIWNPIS